MTWTVLFKFPLNCTIIVFLRLDFRRKMIGHDRFSSVEYPLTSSSSTSMDKSPKSIGDRSLKSTENLSPRLVESNGRKFGVWDHNSSDHPGKPDRKISDKSQKSIHSPKLSGHKSQKSIEYSPKSTTYSPKSVDFSPKSIPMNSSPLSNASFQFSTNGNKSLWPKSGGYPEFVCYIMQPIRDGVSK